MKTRSSSNNLTGKLSSTPISKNPSYPNEIKNTDLNGLHNIYNTNSCFYKYVTNLYLIDLIASFQRLCGIDIHGNVKNKILYYYFKFASTLGDECFLLIPLIFWISFPIAMPFITNFFLLLIIGQLSKDYFRLPRPKSNSNNKTNPFIILDTRFETEYGLPSTHTISGLLPFAILLALARHNAAVIPLNIWISCGIYAISVALSRLYLGVHSIFDVFAGAFIALGGIYILHIFGDQLDFFLYQSPIGIYINISVLIIFLTMYPGLNSPWSASYGTSAQIVGAWLGLGGGSWFLFNCNPKLCDLLLNVSLADPHQFKNLNKQLLDNNYWMENNFSALPSNIVLKRLLLATIIAVITKLLMKYLSEKILLLLLKYNWIIANPIQYKDCFNRNVCINKYYCIEIPSRLLSYGMLGFVSVVLCPYIWSII